MVHVHPVLGLTVCHCQLRHNEETEHKASTQGGERNEHVGTIRRRPSEDPSEPLLSPEAIASKDDHATAIPPGDASPAVAAVQTPCTADSTTASLPNDTARTARDEPHLFELKSLFQGCFVCYSFANRCFVARKLVAVELLVGSR